MSTLAICLGMLAAVRNRNDVIQTRAKRMRPFQRAINSKTTDPTIPFIAFEYFLSRKLVDLSRRDNGTALVQIEPMAVSLGLKLLSLLGRCR
jgi:hypothetical protein